MNSNGASLDQYLTFTLDDELFALNIGWVKEILDDTNITRIPRTPEFIRGVINVRGHAVPVVDLRLKFNMSRTEMTVNTCVIITEIEMDGEKTVIGALADSVQEVVELRPDQIDPPPRMGAAVETRYMVGMGKRNDQFIIILDINGVFSDRDFAAMQAMVEEETEATTEAL